MEATTESESTNHAASSGSIRAHRRQQDGEMHDRGEAGNDTYHETISTQQIPTKAAEEDEMQVDSDRPGTSGTDGSTKLPDEDRKFLATVRASPSSFNEAENPPSKVNFLRRPDSEDVPTPSVPFAYRQAARSAVDFHGTRKDTIRHRVFSQHRPHPSEQNSHPSDGETQDSTGVQKMNEEQLQARIDPVPVHTQLQHEVTRRSLSNEPRNVRKSNKQGRYGPVPVQDIADELNQSLEPIPRRSDALKEGLPVAPPLEKYTNAPETPSAVVVDEESVSRLATPQDLDQPEPGPQDRPSSPNSQLQAEHDRSVEQQKNGRGTRAASEQSVVEIDGAQTKFNAASPIRQSSTLQPGISSLESPLEETQRGGMVQAVRSNQGFQDHTKVSAPAQPMSHLEPVLDSDISDYTQVLLFKVKLQNKQRIASITAERDAIQKELQQREDMVQSLQYELQQAYHERNESAAGCEQQQTTLAKYEAKLNSLSLFINGTTRDLKNLERKAQAARHENEALAEEGEARRLEREALLQHMNDCVEKSARLKSDAFKICHEAQDELQSAKLRANYFEEQLGDKVGLLAEERDRRLQLEQRLLSASEPSERVLQVMKANHDAVLDKLHLVHATLEDTQAQRSILDTLKQTLEAVQALNAQATANAGDAAQTKGLIEALGDRLSEIEDQSLIEPLKKQMDDVLAGLEEVAEHQEDRVRQDSTHREAIDGLQSELKEANARLTHSENELQQTQTRERGLTEEHENLRSRIAAMETRDSSAGDSQPSIEMRSELQAKSQALETAYTSLTSRTAEVEALKRTNQELEAKVQSLREKIEDLEQITGDMIPAKQVIEERIQQEVERVRTESLKHSEEFRAQLDMETRNQLKKLSSDRDRYEKQITPLKAELATSQKQVKELQKKVDTNATMSEQLEQARKLGLLRATEIEGLKTSLRDMQQSSRADASLKEKLAGLSADLEAAKARLEEASKEKSALQEKANSYLHDSTEAQKAGEEVRTELATSRADSATQLEKLKEALKEAQEAHRRVEAGQEHLRKSCNAVIEDEAAKSRRKIEDLQTSLAEAEAETRKERSQAESFRADTEKAWKLETEDHSQELDALLAQIENAETAKDEALAASERTNEECRALTNEITELRQLLDAAEDKLKRQQESSRNVDEACSRLTVPSLSEGLLPSGNVQTSEMAKSRKKVDGHHNTTIDGPAMPAFEANRPEPQTLEQSLSGSSGGAVERAQTGASQIPGPGDAGASKSQLQNFSMFSDAEEMTQLSQHEQSQEPTQMVEETQNDSLPSFAQFNRELSTLDPEPSRSSPSLSMPYGIDFKSIQPTLHRTTKAFPKTSARKYGSGPQEDEAFSIYDDTQDAENQTPRSQHRDSTPAVQDTFDWSQEERDKYTFQKKIPKPNSASKLVRDSNPPQSSLDGKGRSSAPQGRVPLKERRLDTPETHGEGSRASQNSAAHSNSSSPAYLQPTATRTTRTYSNAPRASAPRRSSRTQSNASQDPRLVSRSTQPASKRKPVSQVVEGYEQERKKRLNGASNPLSSDASRFGLRSQQSITELPSLPTTAANPRGSSSQSRLRTLGGSSSRVQGSKKVSKTDEYGARFSQELSGR